MRRYAAIKTCALQLFARPPCSPAVCVAFLSHYHVVRPRYHKIPKHRDTKLMTRCGMIVVHGISFDVEK